MTSDISGPPWCLSAPPPHCGAEKRRASIQATISSHRVRCTDVRWAIGNTIALNLGEVRVEEEEEVLEVVVEVEEEEHLSMEMAMRTFEEMK